MIFRHYRNISTLACVLACGSLSAQSRGAVDLSKIVVAGDSVSAGVENFSLEQDQQIHGYPSVIAQQAGVNMTLPLVPKPGYPNMLQVVSLNPLTIAPVSADPPSSPRVNPYPGTNPPIPGVCVQPTNVSVPGVTLNQALTMAPSTAPSASPVQGWANVVLGFPDPFAAAPCGVAKPLGPVTEIQRAVALQPTAIITWLGNNDVLLPALTGQLSMLTPFQNFLNDYGTLLDTLSQAKVPIMTATIPDVTSIAFFTPVSVVANQVNMTTNQAAQRLGISPNDLLRPTAVQTALDILNGKGGSLSAPCQPPPILVGLVPQVDCVLKAADAATIRQTTLLFNGVIYAQSALHGAAVADVYGLLQQLSQSGYNAGGKHLTTNLLGGIFSLDGVHPSNSGYGIIANTFIDTMNQWWRTNIKHADVSAIAAQDPLFQYVPGQSQDQGDQGQNQGRAQNDNSQR